MSVRIQGLAASSSSSFCRLRAKRSVGFRLLMSSPFAGEWGEAHPSSRPGGCSQDCRGAPPLSRATFAGSKSRHPQGERGAGASRQKFSSTCAILGNLLSDCSSKDLAVSQRVVREIADELDVAQ